MLEVPETLRVGECWRQSVLVSTVTVGRMNGGGGTWRSGVLNASAPVRLSASVSHTMEWPMNHEAPGGINVVVPPGSELVHYMLKLELIKSLYLAQQAKQKKGTVEKL